MKQFTFLIILFFSSLCSAQYVITIEANIIDSDTRLGIPYVNAGFVNKAIGTVTNKDGFMSLQFDESKIVDSDIIQFSVVGYKTQSYSFEELVSKFQKDNTIELIKDVYGLDEVMLTSKWGKAVRFGSKQRTNELLAYWKDKEALGGEIASFIKIPKGRHKLSKVSFNVVENISDSIKIRVNIYNYDKGFPREQFLSKPIYHTISSRGGIETIDLIPANIVVSKDIVLSIELLEVYGEELGLAISQSLNSKRSFLRSVSQDGWVKQNSNGVDLSILAKPSLQNNSEITNIKVDRVSILWDVSRSMMDRSLDKEIELLKEYLGDVNPTEVDVIVFSNTINDKKSFNYGSSQEDLYRFLENQSYFGNTDVSELAEIPQNSDVTFLFSDGYINLGSHDPIYTSGDFIVVSSTPSTNHIVLNEWAQYNEGKYIPLYNRKIKEAKNSLNTSDGVFTETIKISPNDNTTISGTVFFDEQPLSGVLVSINNTFKEIRTDRSGRFKLPAKKGDILNFEFIGMDSKQVVVDDNIRDLSIRLTKSFDVLNEVVVTGSGAVNKNKQSSVEEAYGILKKEDFPSGAKYVADVLKIVPGLTVKGTGRFAQFITNINPIGYFIVDDIPFTSLPLYLDASSISSIYVMPGDMAYFKYGSAASNGAIIINTIVNKEANSALVKGNDYEGNLSQLDHSNSINSFEKTLTDKVIGIDKNIEVRGKVLLNNKPISGCYVIQKGSLNEVITDSNGEFVITTQEGAILSFEYKDTKAKETIILDNSFLKVELEFQYEILNEVALTGEAKQKKDKNLTDKEKRLAQKDRSGIGYQSIDKEDFNPGGFSFLADLIRGRFLTILVKGEGDQATYHTRKRSSILQGDEILFAVDGVLTQTPPTFLDLNRIENITFKSTLAGTNKYGALGRNGVIEIKTIGGEFIDTKESQSPLAKNNDYQEGAKIFSLSRKTGIYNAATTENLKTLQQQFLNKIDEDPLDVNNYIAYYRVLEPLDKDQAVRGLTTILDIADSNTRVLRSLAFFLEEQNLYKQTLKIHERVLELAPEESQSHLDITQSYKREGKFVKSFETLKRILSADSTTYNISPELIKIADTELRHLLTKNKDRINYDEVPSTFYETVQLIDKRILIEWNDPQMEFDLQFVNPAKKFYNWSQNLSTPDKSDVITNGLLSKEFIIDDDSNKGEWIINITNNTFKKSRVPLFVKMTIQSNYGGIDEQEQILIIPISQLDQKYTVQKITM